MRLALRDWVVEVHGYEKNWQWKIDQYSFQSEQAIAFDLCLYLAFTLTVSSDSRHGKIFFEIFEFIFVSVKFI